MVLTQFPIPDQPDSRNETLVKPDGKLLPGMNHGIPVTKDHGHGQLGGSNIHGFPQKVEKTEALGHGPPMDHFDGSTGQNPASQYTNPTQNLPVTTAPGYPPVDQRLPPTRLIYIKILYRNQTIFTAYFTQDGLLGPNITVVFVFENNTDKI